MVFWAFAFLITLAVVAPLIFALRSARDHAISGSQSDIAVYKDQLSEVERDLARGVLTEAEADAVRTEVSRRLLDADRRLADDTIANGRATPAMAAVIVVLVAGGGLFYLQLGAPGYGDMPMAQRLAEIDAAAASRMGQAEAEALIRRFMAQDPENGAARYYAGLTMAQNGRPDQAFPIWRRLLEQSRPEAPWVPVIEAEIAGLAAAAGVMNYSPPSRGLPGPSDADVAAAEDMSEEDRAAMIEGMVEGLAFRLAEEGGPPADWARLITALGVLGQNERATAILTEARSVFAESEDALTLINQAATRAGLQ